MRPFALACLALLLAAGCKKEYVPPDYAVEAYNEGITLYQAGDYAAARERFQFACVGNDNFHQAWHNRGLCDFKLKRYDEAVHGFRIALMNSPDHKPTWSTLALSLFYLERWDESIEAYDRSLELDDNDVAERYNRGLAHFRARHLDAAEADFRFAADKGNENARKMLENVATLREVNRSQEESRKSYLHILHNGVDPLIADGDKAMAEKRYADAVKIYGQAVLFVKDDPNLKTIPEAAELAGQIWLKRGRAHYMAGDGQGAYDDFSRAAGGPSKQIDALAHIAQMSNNGRQSDAALEWADEALKHDPSHSFAHFQRALALFRKGDMAGSETSCRAAIKSNAHWCWLDPREAHLLLGAGQFNKGQYKESMASYAEAKKGAVGAQLCVILTNEAESCFCLDRFQDAEKLLRQALATDNEGQSRAGTHAMLGITLLRLGKLEDAKSWYAKAVAEDVRFGGRQREMLAEGTYYAEKQLAAMDELAGKLK